MAGWQLPANLLRFLGETTSGKEVAVCGCDIHRVYRSGWITRYPDTIPAATPFVAPRAARTSVSGPVIENPVRGRKNKIRRYAASFTRVLWTKYFTFVQAGGADLRCYTEHHEGDLFVKQINSESIR